MAPQSHCSPKAAPGRDAPCWPAWEAASPAGLKPGDDFHTENPPYRAAAPVAGAPAALGLPHLRSPGALGVPVTLQVGRTPCAVQPLLKE